MICTSHNRLRIQPFESRLSKYLFILNTDQVVKDSLPFCIIQFISCALITFLLQKSGMSNILVFIAAPLYSIIFCYPFQPLGQDTFNSENTFLSQIILTNLGAAFGIIFVGISSLKLEFIDQMFHIDILLIILELTSYLHYIEAISIIFPHLFIIKKIGLGFAVGVNFYLALLMVKKKMLIFNEFCKTAILMYIFYAVGIVLGMFIRVISMKYQVFIPLVLIHALLRCIYIKMIFKKQIIQPPQLRGSFGMLTQSIRSAEISDSRNKAIQSLFEKNQIKFLISYYLITIASEITPFVKFSEISIEVTPNSILKQIPSFAFAQLLGSIAIYFYVTKIQSKLKYYLISCMLVSLTCISIGLSEKYSPNFGTFCLILLYNILYGSSLGPFFYIFVGYRYNRIGFAVCYINKWVIYAVIAVVNKNSKKLWIECISSSIGLILIIFLLYILLKQNQLNQIKEQKKFLKLEKRNELSQSMEEFEDMRESAVNQTD